MPSWATLQSSHLSRGRCFRQPRRPELFVQLDENCTLGLYELVNLPSKRVPVFLRGVISFDRHNLFQGYLPDRRAYSCGTNVGGARNRSLSKPRSVNVARFEPSRQFGCLEATDVLEHGGNLAPFRGRRFAVFV